MSDKPDHPRQELRDLIKDIRFAMFTTAGPDGALRSRPMTTQKDDDAQDGGDGDRSSHLWFFMSRSSDTARELQEEPRVSVSYADTDNDAYVAVTGRAQLVDDIAKKRQLWSTMTAAWFPKGVDDPELALVRVDVEEAEYWNVKESKLVQVAKMMTAAVTGKPPTDMGNHAKVKGA